MSSRSKEMIGEALDNLSNKIFDEYFDSKEQDLTQKTQLIASLFQNQLTLENQYRSELIQAGVSLPEEDQSANYIDIVNKIIFIINFYFSKFSSNSLISYHLTSLIS